MLFTCKNVFAKRLNNFWWNLKSYPKCWFTNNYSDWDFRVRITNHKSFDLDRYFRARLWINRFRSGLQSEDHESFDLNRYFRARLWIIIQIWTSERGSWIIWSRSELRSGFVNHYPDLECVSQIIWFKLGFGACSRITWFRREDWRRFINILSDEDFQIAYCESFECVEQIIWFR